MRLLLDTNCYSAADRGDPAVLRRLEQAARLYMSLVVVGELKAGFAGGNRRRSNEANLQTFLALPGVTLLPVTLETCGYYAIIKTQLRRQGTPIPTNDIWIAAQALQHNLTLDSRDQHFQRVKGLRLV